MKRLSSILPHLSGGTRIKTLDGLRGFLALGVVFSHFLSYRQYMHFGKWAWPTNYPFFYWSAQLAVLLFFCITGYLFWGKVRRGGGKIDAWDLYVRRFWRIYPLYAFLAITTFLICLLPKNHESASRLLQVALLWVIPGLNPTLNLNGVNTGPYLTQTWTLLKEVIFYVLLPIIAFVSRNPKVFLGLAFAIAIFIGLQPTGTFIPNFLYAFMIGMGTAQLESESSQRCLQGPIGTGCVVIGLAFSYFHGLMPIEITFCLALVFAPIANGNSVFGLLSLRACRLLGDVSYSIYMLHLLVLNVSMAAVHPWAGKLDGRQWWAFTGLDIVCLLFVSLASYQLLERPFLSGNPLRARIQQAAP